METSLHHFIIAAIRETVLIRWTTAGVTVEPDVLKILSHYLHLYMRVCVMMGETITQKHLFSCRFTHCRWFWSLTIHLWSYAYLIQAWRGWAGSLCGLAGQRQISTLTSWDSPGWTHADRTCKQSRTNLDSNPAPPYCEATVLTTCHACWCLFLHIIFSSTDGNNKHLTAWFMSQKPLEAFVYYVWRYS